MSLDHSRTRAHQKIEKGFCLSSTSSSELRFAPWKATPHLSTLHPRPLTPRAPPFAFHAAFPRHSSICPRSSLPPRVRSPPTLASSRLSFREREREGQSRGERREKRKAPGHRLLARLATGHRSPVTASRSQPAGFRMRQAGRGGRSSFYRIAGC
jgi:hypothetical protein